MARVNLSRKKMAEAMQSKPVREALKDKAKKLSRRADQLGGSEGVDMDATVEEGIRPKGRPYANVTSKNSAQEWGDRYTERRRILGRVAEEG